MKSAQDMGPWVPAGRTKKKAASTAAISAEEAEAAAAAKAAALEAAREAAAARAASWVAPPPIVPPVGEPLHLLPDGVPIPPAEPPAARHVVGPRTKKRQAAARESPTLTRPSQQQPGSGHPKAPTQKVSKEQQEALDQALARIAHLEQQVTMLMPTRSREKGDEGEHYNALAEAALGAVVGEEDQDA